VDMTMLAFFLFFFCMTISRILGGGFEFSAQSPAGTWRWKVTSNNQGGSQQRFQVQDIFSPYGKLGQVDLPIPESIFTSIAESLESLKEQLKPELLLTSDSSLSVTITEGDASIILPNITFMNVGAMGSSMDAFITTDSPSFIPIRSSVLNVGKNEFGTFSVRLDPTLLLADGSPYSANASIAYTSSDVITNVEYTVNVLPKPQIALDRYNLTFAFDSATSVVTGAQAIVVTNAGPSDSLLSATVEKTTNSSSSWTSLVVPVMKDIPATYSESFMVSVNLAKAPRIPGYYQESIIIKSPNASNSPVVLGVLLVVT